MRKFLAGLSMMLFCTVLVVQPPTHSMALQSTNFRFSEPSLGGIGKTDTGSTSYKALTSGGIIGFGNSTSGTMQINSGGRTTDEPALSFAVAGSGVNLGNFSPTLASTATSTFAVSDYTSYGYIVQIIGTPPTNGVHTIDAMATTTVSQVGIEQFGINLVANTSPSSFGTNPDHGQFGFGDPSPNYATPNNYRFVSGDTIVIGPKSSGVTIYTMSYLINVSSITQGGKYTSDQTVICTATF